MTVLDGEIHSFKNNTNHGDYGSTIIVKYEIKGEIFYSLYRHLSIESLVQLKVEQKIKQGEKRGSLSSNVVNGDYVPYLHF